MTQIGFPLSEAHEALDQFLNGDRDHGGDRIGRWIGEHDDGSTDYGDVAAHIVSGGRYRELVNGERQWREAEEVRREAIEPPAGYTPWRHSPLATQDRSLPVEPLLDVLARAIFRKPYAELEDDGQDQDQWRVRATAIMCLLEVQLDTDGQGAVPILMLGHDTDEPGPPLRWRIAYKTDVRGLYLHSSGNGFFGEEWGILTGSGYCLARGWYERDEAAAAVAALGRVLPNADWMRLGPDGFTDRAKAAIGAVITRYRLQPPEGAPEPEVVDDAFPAPSAESAALTAPADEAVSGNG